MSQSTPREPKVPHHNLTEVSGPSMPPKSENIVQKQGEHLSRRILSNNRRLTFALDKKKSQTKRRATTLNSQENLQCDPNIGEEIATITTMNSDKTTLQASTAEAVKFLKFANLVIRNRKRSHNFEQEEPLSNRHHSRLSPNSGTGRRAHYSEQEKPLSFNNEFRQNNFSRGYSRDSQVPKLINLVIGTIIIPDCAPIEEQEEEPIAPKRKNRNRRSKQTMRLQRLLIQPQWNDESESTEDDSDEDILMSQLNPIST
ncbi:hypothetical protein WMY93_023033 [Mugilogobius chulae]|uniref:Uncharacterized protein n=1 Tax=Mugilogobius chulae TaxID=88201 RepID=A0AAW0ND54_9GOBI